LNFGCFLMMIIFHKLRCEVSRFIGIFLQWTFVVCAGQEFQSPVIMILAMNQQIKRDYWNWQCSSCHLEPDWLVNSTYKGEGVYKWLNIRSTIWEFEADGTHLYYQSLDKKCSFCFSFFSLNIFNDKHFADCLICWVPVCSSGWGTDLQWVDIKVGPFNPNVFNLPPNCNSKCDSTLSVQIMHLVTLDKILIFMRCFFLFCFVKIDSIVKVVSLQHTKDPLLFGNFFIVPKITTLLWKSFYWVVFQFICCFFDL
jgi:hypothetical protein